MDSVFHCVCVCTGVGAGVGWRRWERGGVSGASAFSLADEWASRFSSLPTIGDTVAGGRTSPFDDRK